MRYHSLWLIGVLSEGALGLVGPLASTATTPGALALGVPYWNLGRFDWAATPEKREPARARAAAATPVEARIVKGKGERGGAKRIRERDSSVDE